MLKRTHLSPSLVNFLIIFAFKDDMVALCRAAGIPARLVSGIILKDDIVPQRHFWVEVYQDRRWLSYDVHFGFKNTVPSNYLSMRRNGKNIIETINGNHTQIVLKLEQEFSHPFLRQIQQDQFTTIFDLTRFPFIQFETLGPFILQYPEIHFTTLALFVLLSQYKGMQLINLPLINFLAEPEASNIKQPDN